MLRLSRLPKRSGSMPWAYPSISLYIACGQKTYRLFRIFPARKNNNYKKRSPESAPSFPGSILFSHPPCFSVSLFSAGLFSFLCFCSLLLSSVSVRYRLRSLSSPFVIVFPFSAVQMRSNSFPSECARAMPPTLRQKSVSASFCLFCPSSTEKMCFPFV